MQYSVHANLHACHRNTKFMNVMSLIQQFSTLYKSRMQEYLDRSPHKLMMSERTKLFQFAHILCTEHTQ